MEDSDQTAWMLRLISIFAGHTSDGMYSDVALYYCLLRYFLSIPMSRPFNGTGDTRLNFPSFPLRDTTFVTSCLLCYMICTYAIRWVSRSKSFLIDKTHFKRGQNNFDRLVAPLTPPPPPPTHTHTHTKSVSLPPVVTTLSVYEGPAKSFVTGFGLLQCYVLSNIFILQTFKVFPLYWNTCL